MQFVIGAMPRIMFGYVSFDTESFLTLDTIIRYNFHSSYWKILQLIRIPPTEISDLLDLEWIFHLIGLLWFFFWSIGVQKLTDIQQI